MSNLVLAKPQIIGGIQKGLVVTKNTIIKQSPIILAGVGITSVVTTAILASKATIIADQLIKDAENEKKKAQGEDATLTTIEKVQAGWKPYVPTIISCAVGVSAITGSVAISQKRQAALAGLYALSETALKEYQDKIEKEYGPKEAQKLRDQINSDRVQNADVPPWDDSVLPQGDVWCYDKFSGRYFFSSAQKISLAVSEVNESIYGGGMCVSLNEFYGILNNDRLGPCGLGDDVGWNINANCKPYFTSCLTSDMKPCLILDWSNGHEPTPRYRDI